MSFTFNAQCSKCKEKFEANPGELNSTKYLGKTSVVFGAGGYLPKCPHCGNFRDNQLIGIDGTLSKPLAI